MPNRLHLTCGLPVTGTLTPRSSPWNDTRRFAIFLVIHCRLSGLLESIQYLLRLAGSLGLSLQVGRGRTVREETGEQWLDEGVEDNLGAAVVMSEFDSRKTMEACLIIL